MLANDQFMSRSKDADFTDQLQAECVLRLISKDMRIRGSGNRRRPWTRTEGLVAERAG